MSKINFSLKDKVKKKQTMFLIAAFMIPVVTGLAIGLSRLPEIVSAIASFFVTDPVKSLNVDRGYSADSTSQLNVQDDEAINGYIIKARLGSGVDANFTVRIWSDDSSICTTSSPCLLTGEDVVIYGNGTNSATVGSGDVIDFSVRVNSAMTTDAGAYDVDIIYTKERAYTMQAFNAATCAAMPVYYPLDSPPAGSEVDLVDIRDGKTYKVRKLPIDTIGTAGWCWMVDNLALQPNASNPMILDSTNSDIASGTYTLTAANVLDPNTLVPNGYCGNLNVNTYPNKCGAQYTWTTATTGSTIASGNAPSSICPKNWKLLVDGDYTVLQTALGWGDSGANINSLNGWRGLYAGISGSSNQGTVGYYWSGTARSASSAAVLVYSAADVFPSSTGDKSSAFSVRCLVR